MFIGLSAANTHSKSFRYDFAVIGISCLAGAIASVLSTLLQRSSTESFEDISPLRMDFLSKPGYTVKVLV